MLVRASFEASHQRYSSPRVLDDLRENSERVGRHRVIRLMRLDGLRARTRKRFKCTTRSDHQQPVPDNMLARNFEADAPSRRWVGDTTEMLMVDGAKFYVAAIVDLHSRLCVGWAVSAVNDRHLAMHALEAAIRRRCPAAGLVHHSDRGSTHASEDYRDLLAAHGIACSYEREREMRLQAAATCPAGVDQSHSGGAASALGAGTSRSRRRQIQRLELEAALVYGAILVRPIADK